MADERSTRLNEGLDKWLQVTGTDKLETWDGTDKMAAIKESLGINDKVAISDIVDDLNSTDVDKPLSANQGKQLNDDKASLSGGADANFALMPQVNGSPIISRGSNSDGEFIRYSDGTQICHYKDVDVPRVDNQSAGTTLNRTWTYPQSFIENPAFLVKEALREGGSRSRRRELFISQNVFNEDLWDIKTSLPVRLHIFQNTGMGHSPVISCFAIGRWY